MQKHWEVRNFYIDETFKPIYQEFKEICFREGESVSEKLREYIMRYVSIHAHGNPQLILEKFMGEIKLGECFFCKGQFELLKKVEYASGLIAPTCEDCLNRNKAKGTFSTVKKVLGLMK
jgi:hypothetical protein